MNKNKFKDILVRTIKTFIQGFLASIVVIPQTTDFNVWKPILIGAVAGGISAVMNLIINLLKKGDE
jgi:hypothetical protein